MPRSPRRALIWSRDDGRYALYTRGQPEPSAGLADDAALQAWLGEVDSFAFHGAAGSLNVYHETRARGGRYWYAYHTGHQGTRKRSLGPTERISLAQLEETARKLSHEEQQAPPTTGEGMVLLAASRLVPPRLPNSLVTRPRLLAALDGALATPLTLLSASAGWGKTTLLSAWAGRQSARIAWVSLDELDNTPARFWGALVAALRRCGGYAPTVGETALALLQSPQPPALTTILAALLQGLERQEGQPASVAPVVLIVDDYQVIGDAALHESLRFFLEHLPVHLHVILASQVDPDLPLARWRTRGYLTEIRTDDLRFSSDEASQFLGHLLSPELSDDEARRLTARTEGWAAGLQLAALALQKRGDRVAFVQAFTGSQRYLLDYVQEEILARLPAHVRDFLLHIAILSRLDAAVCQAVTAAPTAADCQQMLSYLERHNLFLFPLDEERRWYRVHDLFREAVLVALGTTQPELAPVLHRRAASYYETQGEWAEAVTHWLAAADYSAAARLMQRTVEQFWERAEAATMAQWVLALPQSLVREHARLALTTALYLLNTVAQTTREQRGRFHHQAQQLMARVELALPPPPDEAGQKPMAAGAGTGAGAGHTMHAGDPEANAAEVAVLQARLRLLRMQMVLAEAIAAGGL